MSTKDGADDLVVAKKGEIDGRANAAKFGALPPPRHVILFALSRVAASGRDCVSVTVEMYGGPRAMAQK